ncbi:MAG: hypothetical protein K2X29_00925 [Candidatus Obscuribacterales bacterium]|nr:hypothetical protein [Candidatus Obscuribacterales bacterium]
MFSALSLLFFLGLMKLVNTSKFRSEEGDTTYEVGYEEDPEGHSRKQEEGSITSGSHTPNASISDYYNVGP